MGLPGCCRCEIPKDVGREIPKEARTAVFPSPHGSHEKPYPLDVGRIVVVKRFPASSPAN
jgi:hypothetical protein